MVVATGEAGHGPQAEQEVVQHADPGTDVQHVNGRGTNGKKSYINPGSYL